jgi:Grx4 family monothiol glutaredoxin
MTLDPETRKKIEQLVTSDSVVLFMKGSRSFPQCGFSASVVNILNTLIPKYTTVNILTDADVRTGMKEYSDWPTFPQLFVKGEFVGGADIMREMYEAGELQQLLALRQSVVVGMDDLDVHTQTPRCFLRSCRLLLLLIVVVVRERNQKAEPFHGPHPARMIDQYCQ